MDGGDAGGLWVGNTHAQSQQMLLVIGSDFLIFDHPTSV